MPRKKQTIEQPINLTPDVQVIVRADRDHWPTINWNGGRVEIIAESATRYRQVEGSPTAEPPADIAQLRKRLPADPTSGGIARVKKETKPFTSEDAFAEAGLDLDPGELSGEGLVALADAAKAMGGGG